MKKTSPKSKRSITCCAVLTLIISALSAAVQDPVIPDFAKDLPDVVLAESIKEGNKETIRLRTGLSAKEFTAKIRSFMKKAGWRNRKLTKSDMTMAAQKGRMMNVEVRLYAYENAELPGTFIQVFYLLPKVEKKRASIEIVVNRPSPAER